MTPLTIDDAAKLAGLRPLKPLIKREPCYTCSDNRMESETGYHYCARSQHGDPECSTYHDVRQLEVVALEMAALIRTLSDQEMRRELGTGVVDGLANALYVRGQSPQIDADEFLRRSDALREGAG